MAAGDAKSSMTDEEKFFFDLNGFIHVRGALSAEEVKSLNDGIDAHRGEIKERTDTALRNTKADSPLAGDGSTGRRDLGGMLGWPKPHCLPWRSLLSHPRLLPYLTTLCGPGYRMDHLPLIITSYKGSEGFHLHGGPLTEAGHFNPTLQYRCVNGQFYNSLLAMSVQLVDHAPGDGGFCVIRGSHKLNFPVPHDFLHGAGAEAKEHFYQPATRAGDVLFFSEATVHGAMAWTAEHERRIAIYRFAPATVAYGRSYSPSWPQEMLEDLTASQRAVLEPPYAGAGDVLFFSEATVHGAMAWTAEHERRIAIYRFAPATVAYGRSYSPSWPQEMLEDLTASQRAVLEPPYAGRLDRPIVRPGREDPEMESRSAKKKKFDEEVFGTKYF